MGTQAQVKLLRGNWWSILCVWVCVSGGCWLSGGKNVRPSKSGYFTDFLVFYDGQILWRTFVRTFNLFRHRRPKLSLCSPMAVKHAPSNCSLGNLNTRRAAKHSLFPRKERRGWAFALWTLPFIGLLWDLASSRAGQTSGAPLLTPVQMCACEHTIARAHTLLRDLRSQPQVCAPRLHLTDRRRRESRRLEKTLQLSINTNTSIKSTPVPWRDHPSPPRTESIHICPAHGSA